MRVQRVEQSCARPEVAGQREVRHRRQPAVRDPALHLLEGVALGPTETVDALLHVADHEEPAVELLAQARGPAPSGRRRCPGTRPRRRTCTAYRRLVLLAQGSSGGRHELVGRQGLVLQATCARTWRCHLEHDLLGRLHDRGVESRARRRTPVDLSLISRRRPETEEVDPVVLERVPHCLHVTRATRRPPAPCAGACRSSPESGSDSAGRSPPGPRGCVGRPGTRGPGRARPALEATIRLASEWIVTMSAAAQLQHPREHRQRAPLAQPLPQQQRAGDAVAHLGGGLAGEGDECDLVSPQVDRVARPQPSRAPRWSPAGRRCAPTSSRSCLCPRRP